MKKYLMSLETKIVFYYDEVAKVYRGLSPINNFIVEHAYNVDHTYVAHDNILLFLQKDDLVVYFRKNGDRHAYFINSDVELYGNYVRDNNSLYSIDNELNYSTFILKLEPSGNYTKYEVK